MTENRNAVVTLAQAFKTVIEGSTTFLNDPIIRQVAGRLGLSPKNPLIISEADADTLRESLTAACEKWFAGEFSWRDRNNAAEELFQEAQRQGIIVPAPA